MGKSPRERAFSRPRVLDGAFASVSTRGNKAAAAPSGFI